MGPPPLGWPWDTPSPEGTCPGASCRLLLSPGCHRGGQQAVAATQAPVPRHPGPPAPCQGQGHPRGAAQLTLLCWGGCRGLPLTCLYLPVPCPPTAGGGNVSSFCLGGAGGQGPPCSPLCWWGWARAVPRGPSGICTNLCFLIKLRFVFLSGLLSGLVSPSLSSTPPRRSFGPSLLQPDMSLSTPCSPLSRLTPPCHSSPGGQQRGGSPAPS